MILSAEEVCNMPCVYKKILLLHCGPQVFCFVSRFLITRNGLHPGSFSYPEGHKHSVALGLQTPACMFSL